MLKKFKFSKQAAIILLLPVYLLFIWPFLNNIVFDSVVHFAFAEKFIQGAPFKYNFSDNFVLASTSPFWTVLIIFFHFAAGYKSIILIKVFAFFALFTAAYFIYKSVKDELNNLQILIIILFWLLNISVVKNSLGGMENILAAVQLLMLYYLVKKSLDKLSKQNAVLMGVITGWTILTRPEMGILCLFITAVYYYYFSGKAKKEDKIVSKLLLYTASVILVLIPWYIYQHSVTGRFISDSSYARMYAGRWNSYVIFSGIIYLHPKAIMSLLTAFLPLTAGFIYEWKKIAGKIFKPRELFENKNNFLTGISVLIVLYGVFFFTFVVGGDQTGRYLLPIYPFLFIVGFKGLFSIYEKIKSRTETLSKVIIVFILLFFMVINGYDYFGRVITGLALESDIEEHINAPGRRHEFTSAFLKKMGFEETDKVKIAVVEVQFRYYVDERITVESLDGRSSSKVFKYIDEDGFPDFEKFIAEEKPDVIEINGWNAYTSAEPEVKWINYGKKDNVLANWDIKTNDVKIGESFMWNDHKVTYVFPGYIKINWRE